MRRTPIDELQPGTSLSKQPFLLRDKSMTTTRTGALLLRVGLGDRTGSLPGIMFDAPARLMQDLVVGGGVEVTGRVEEYRDTLQIRMDRILVTELGDMAEYLPSAQRPIGEMQRELDALIASVQQSDLNRLLLAVLGSGGEYRVPFREAPAAKQMHHACRGGLLQHTLSVAALVQAAVAAHPELDRDMALAIALLHDLGKCRAYDPTTFDMTDEGSLWGHLYMSASLTEAAIAQLPGFDRQVRLTLIHGILAHHGSLDHGSPVLPMTAEAMAVHHADAMDADLQGAAETFGRVDSQAGPYTGWSAMHETRLYRGVSEASDTYGRGDGQ
ncbi:MAG: 3'-5' exoribonuclease YhaM family protein [Anaerolineae bacterium]|nr:HD domain-containing protein [Chloroflexota bacterium]